MWIALRFSKNSFLSEVEGGMRPANVARRGLLFSAALSAGAVASALWVKSSSGCWPGSGSTFGATIQG